MDSTDLMDPRLRTASPALGQTTAKAIFRTRKLPLLDEPVGHHEADVVASVGVLATGVAEPDDQPVGRGAAAEGAQELPL